MTKLSELKYKYIPQLMDAGIEREEATTEFELVVKHCCEITSKEIVLDCEINIALVSNVDAIMKKRIETRQPIQQILGEAFFMGNYYIIDEFTLIPRPETELLVSEAVTILKHINEPKVLDIGTGSGCIACAIAKNIENIEIIGVDISTKALHVALKNAEKLDIIRKVLFRKSDLFSNVTEKFDMIISNPPYIPRSTQSTLQTEVRDFEPSVALFTEDDLGLEFYDKIIAEAHEYLNLEGYLLFEVGAGQAVAVKDLLLQNSFRVIKTVNDFSGIERVIVAQTD